MGAFSGAATENPGPIDPELQALVDAWLTLPEAIRAGIVAMVKVAASHG